MKHLEGLYRIRKDPESRVYKKRFFISDKRNKKYTEDEFERLYPKYTEYIRDFRIKIEKVKTVKPQQEVYYITDYGTSGSAKYGKSVSLEEWEKYPFYSKPVFERR